MTNMDDLGQGKVESNYASLAVLFALLLGGGTEQGLWSDHFIQLLMTPLIILGFLRLPASELNGWIVVVCVLSFGLVALQFLPVSSQLTLPNSVEKIELAFWSASPSRSVEAALFFATCLGVFLYVSSISMPTKIKLLKVILIGILIQSLLVIVQLSYSTKFELLGFLPFTITSGLFANQNHFSTMLFSSIPILGFIFLIIQNNKLLFMFLSFLIILLLFAIGSRVGMTFAVVQIMMTLIWYFTQNLRNIIRFTIIAFCLIAGIFAIIFLDFFTVLEGDLRSEIFENTLNAIKENLPFGTGLGTFVLLYPSYESIAEINTYYINHAHNDYFELLLELGVLVGLPFFIYLVLLVNHSFSRKYAGILGLTIFAILAHSLLDYPLRTFSVAIIFTTVSAILFYRERKGQPRYSRNIFYKLSNKRSTTSGLLL